MSLNMGLDMSGHIDDTFQSVPAERISKTGGSYVDGIWVPGTETRTHHKITLQPATDDELDFLRSGGERVVDARKIYVNDGDIYNITESDLWEFSGISGTFKSVKLDNRPWRNYCKVTVVRLDE